MPPRQSTVYYRVVIRGPGTCQALPSMLSPEFLNLAEASVLLLLSVFCGWGSGGTEGKYCVQECRGGRNRASP